MVGGLGWAARLTALGRCHLSLGLGVSGALDLGWGGLGALAVAGGGVAAASLKPRLCVTSGPSRSSMWIV